MEAGLVYSCESPRSFACAALYVQILVTQKMKTVLYSPVDHFHVLRLRFELRTTRLRVGASDR